MVYRKFDTFLTEVNALRAAGSSIYIVHYACGNLYQGNAEISAVAFRELLTEGMTVFSRIDREEHQEQYVVSKAIEFMSLNRGAHFIHWNMNSADFGFQAIENRYYRLGLGSDTLPSLPAIDHRIDLDAVIALGYGEDYADHPKLKNLGTLNGFPFRYFLNGNDEVDRFAKNEHGDIRRSLDEKVSLIAKLATLTLDGNLETKRAGKKLEFAGSLLDSVHTVTTIGQRFLDVSRQLERRHDNRPTIKITDEYDSQDLFHGLLRVFFDDIRREEWTPSYAGGASRMDFLIPRYKLAIELKFSRNSMTTKKLGEELIVDIAKYQSHADVRHLVCLVFDQTGQLQNPRGIERDLSVPKEGLGVTVQIYDR
jgi:hypothetical protein